MRTGFANLPLHGGSCPKWLFPRMKKLSGEITEIIIYEYGQEEFLKRLSDPFFFQSFGCVVGYDWHSSGLTTTLTAAIKESLNEKDLGINVCGGKGKTSRKTPEEIENVCEKLSLSTTKAEDLVYSSRMSAKIDNTAVQDGYQLYHHAFVLSEKGDWAVIQQGMSSENKYARRYHWLSLNVVSFVEEPHAAICSEALGETLNMTAKESRNAREISVDIIKDGSFEKDMKILDMHPQHTFNLATQTKKAIQNAYELQPENYEELLALKGLGPKAVRALALISQLVYGSSPSWKDPAKFSFAHGGKDGIPYPVNKELMDENTEMLRNALSEARLGDDEKLHAIRRLKDFTSIQGKLMSST